MTVQLKVSFYTLLQDHLQSPKLLHWAKVEMVMTKNTL